MRHHLGDPVVVGQEHGKVLRLLDGLGVCHLPQELCRPAIRGMQGAKLQYNQPQPGLVGSRSHLTHSDTVPEVRGLRRTQVTLTSKGSMF